MAGSTRWPARAPLNLARAAASGRGKHLPLDSCPVCATEIKPSLGSLGLACGPRLRGRDGRLDPRLEGDVMCRVEGVELNLPPEADRIEHLAGFARRGPARLREQVGKIRKARVEDRVVRAGNLGRPGQPRNRPWLGGGQRQREDDKREDDTRHPRTSHRRTHPRTLALPQLAPHVR
jgi:hypothetical protein